MALEVFFSAGAAADVEHHEIEDEICTVLRGDWAKKGTIGGKSWKAWGDQKSEPSTYISQIPANGTLNEYN